MWKTIETYPDYEVNTQGEVRRKNNKRLLKPCITPSGYYRVNLRKNKKSYTAYIHRLVAEAFLSKAIDHIEVNHKDGDKSNNHVENLEWTTHAQNVQHAFSELKRQPSRGRKKIKVVFMDGKELIFETQVACAQYFNVDPTTIRDYLNHSSKSRSIKATFERID